ncbi:MAG: PQQ-binding-like beta-propeller repeat protein [Planctomycetes bacterium]|nr:PQQ-binding-like beta-propeller repeat protein [Planctomycetota bacterium]
MASALAALLLLLTIGSAAGQDAKKPRVDAVGDPLPAQALHRIGTSRFCTQTEVASLVLSPDAKLLAAADRDGRCYLWETEAGKERLRSDAGAGKRVLFSPDGRWLALGDGAPLELRRLSDDKRLRLDLGFTPTAFAFAPDSKALAVAGGENGDIALHEVATGKEIRPLERLDFDLAANAIAYSGDGKLVAAGGFPKVDMNKPFVRIVLWDAAKGKVLKQFDHAGRSVNGLMFLPDRRTVVAQIGSRLAGWDIASGERVVKIAHDVGSAFAVDADATLLATTDGPKLVDFASGKIVHDFEDPTHFRHVALSGDGKLIATAPARLENAAPRIQLWDVAARRERRLGAAHQHAVDAVAFSHDGKAIATASHVEGIARVWDAKTAKWLHTFNLESLPAKKSGGPRARYTLLDGLAFSADRPELLISGQRWDLTNAKPIPLQADEDFLFEQTNSRRAIVSPDGRVFASYLRDNSIVFWDSAKVAPVKRIEPGASGPAPKRDWRTLALTPDARFAAVGLWFAPLGKNPESPLVPTIEIWDITAGKRVRSLRSSPTPIVRMMFAPDGETLAVIGFPNRLELWHLPTGRLLREMYLTEIVDDAPRPFAMPAVAFAPHGQWLAYAHQPGQIAILETITGKELLTLSGHHGEIASMAFAPNGTRLLSGGRDTTTIMWSVVPETAAPPANWKDADKLWLDLGGPAHSAYPVIWALMAHPERALDVFGKHLRPDTGATEKEIASLIANLSSEKFPQRDAALHRLKQIGARSLPALEQALKKAPNLETGRRIRELLQTVETALTPEALRDLRGLLVLEIAATPQARQLLAMIARGDPSAGKTRIAQTALARIAVRD